MKNRAIIPLALGVVIGLLAIKFSIDAIRRARGANAPTIMVNAVLANQDIPASIRITPDMLVVRKTPKTPLLPSDAYTSAEELVRRVTRKGIPQGTPINPSMIAPEGSLPGIEERIPEGYRAVAVKIDEAAGVAYLLRPGCFVDVIVVMDVKRAGRKSETISRVILQRVKVAAVGQALGEQTKEGANRVKSATLIVKEENVPKLHLAQTKGRLTLAMRAENDQLITDGANASQSDLLGEKPAVPAAPETATVSPTPSLTSLLSSTPIADAGDDQNNPVTVTVVNGSRADGADVSRLMFESPYSMTVVGVSRGLTSGDPGGTYVPKKDLNDRYDGAPRRVLTDRERRLRRLGARMWDGAADRNEDDDNSKEVGE